LSVEAKSNGNLRLRCDVEDCDRKFIPRRPFQRAEHLRLRAALFGWLCSITDLCPTHSKEREQ
jgi:hypothetical protein